MIDTLFGLPANTIAGLYIGFNCDDEDGVGGHYFEGMSTDPWITIYISDAHSVLQISLTMSDFTFMAAYPALGRVVVAHDSIARITCGLSGQASILKASVGAYPDYHVH